MLNDLQRQLQAVRNKQRQPWDDTWACAQNAVESLDLLYQVLGCAKVASIHRPCREFRINPLYAVERRGNELHLRLQFPNADYEDEYGACKQYLPDTTVIDAAALAALQGGSAPQSLDDQIRRRVIVRLPEKYY